VLTVGCCRQYKIATKVALIISCCTTIFSNAPTGTYMYVHREGSFIRVVTRRDRDLLCDWSLMACDQPELHGQSYAALALICFDDNYLELRESMLMAVLRLVVYGLVPARVSLPLLEAVRSE